MICVTSPRVKKIFTLQFLLPVLWTAHTTAYIRLCFAMHPVNNALDLQNPLSKLSCVCWFTAVKIETQAKDKASISLVYGRQPLQQTNQNSYHFLIDPKCYFYGHGSFSHMTKHSIDCTCSKIKAHITAIISWKKPQNLILGALPSLSQKFPPLKTTCYTVVRPVCIPKPANLSSW